METMLDSTISNDDWISKWGLRGPKDDERRWGRLGGNGETCTGEIASVMYTLDWCACECSLICGSSVYIAKSSRSE